MTADTLSLEQLEAFYETAEREYLRSLPLEHFMEATDHAHQRKLTLESFDLIGEARPDIQCFNELLVQYPLEGESRLGQVVPDNMVVVHPEPIAAVGSFNTPLQPVGPLLMLEYVSRHNRRKDYDANMVRYQRELRVPYYLLFTPHNEALTLFRLIDGRYAEVTANAAGRLSIPELEVEAAVRDGWVRYWFRGELVPLPGELLRERNVERRGRRRAEERAEAEGEARRVEAEARRAAEQEASLERQARLSLEEEVVRLRERLAATQGPAEG